MLLIHAKNFRFRARRKAICEAEDLSASTSLWEGSNVLVVFATVESRDVDVEDLVKAACNEIAFAAKSLGVSAVVIYPYAHLSDDLARPSSALRILRRIERELRGMGFSVVRAPFGWYKEFELHCYGHPLSELSRTVKPASARSLVDKKPYEVLCGREAKCRTWASPPEKFSGGVDIRDMTVAELLRRSVKEGFPEVDPGELARVCEKFGYACKERHGIVRVPTEESAQINELVIERSWQLVSSMGVTTSYLGLLNPIEEDEALAASIGGGGSCQDRGVASNEVSEGMRGFSAVEICCLERLQDPLSPSISTPRCQPSMVPTVYIPLKGLRTAAQMLLKVCATAIRELAPRSLPVVALTEVGSGLSVAELLELRELPANARVVTVERLETEPVGFLVKLSCMIHNPLIDSPSVLLQGCVMKARKQKENAPYLLKVNLVVPEVYLLSIFVESVLSIRRGVTPTLPTWLTPVQVVVIPVSTSERVKDYALKVASSLKSLGVRVRIDDRDLPLGRRIRAAGLKWVPMVIVVGDKEVEAGTVNVRLRAANEQLHMKLEEFLRFVHEYLESV